MKEKIELQLKNLVTDWIYTKLEDTHCLAENFVKFDLDNGKTTRFDKSEIRYIVNKDQLKEERVENEELSSGDSITVAAKTTQEYHLSVEDEKVKSTNSSRSKSTTLNFGLSGAFGGVDLGASAGIEWTHTNSEGKSETVRNKREHAIKFKAGEKAEEYSVTLYRTADIVTQDIILELTGAVGIKFTSGYKVDYNKDTKQFSVEKALHPNSSKITIPLRDILTDLKQMKRLPDENSWEIDNVKTSYKLELRQVKKIHGISLQSKLLRYIDSPLEPEQNKKKDKEEKKPTKAVFSSKSVGLVVETDATKGLPSTILDAIAKRAQESGDASLRKVTFLYEQLKAPNLDKIYKDKTLELISEVLTKNEQNPNFAALLKFLHENPEQHPEVKFEEEDVIFQGPKTSVSTAIEHEDINTKFNQLITDKLTRGYEFKLSRPNGKQLFIVCTPPNKEKPKVLTNTLGELQNTLQQCLQANSLNVKITEDEKAEKETLCIESEDSSTLNKVTQLLKKVADVQLSKDSIPQAFFKWPDFHQPAEKQDSEVSAVCKVQ